MGTPSTPENEADILLHLDMNDVRLAGSLNDYAGELTVSSEARITDRENGSVAEDPGTVEICRSSSWRTAPQRRTRVPGGRA